MRSSKLDFSGASNIVDPFAGLKGALQQTSGTIGQMLDSSEKAKERAADEAYRRDALAIQQAQEKRAADAAQLLLDDRAANTKFASDVLKHEGKTWAPTGDLLNQSPEVITSKMELLDTDTPEQKAEKLKMQQGLSDWYDTQGRKLYESEKMADIIAQREKAGQAVTPDMLAAMSGARKAELDTRTKQSEAQSKLAAELASDKNKYLVDMAKMQAQDNRAVLKASGSKSTSGGTKGEVASIKDSQEVRDYVINQVSAPGFSWAGNSDIDEAVRKLDALGVDKDMAKMAMSSGIKMGKLDTTFDLEEFNKNLPNVIQLASDIKAKKGGSGSYSASYGSQSVQNPGVGVLQGLYQDTTNQAIQAQTKAANYLVDPDVARSQIAKVEYDKYLTDLMGKTKTPAATSTGAGEQVAGTNAASVTERVQEGTPRYKTGYVDGNGLNKDGTLNKAAIDAINAALPIEAKRRLPDRVTPEQANTIVNTLMADGRIKNSDNTGVENDKEYSSPYNDIQKQAAARFNELQKRTDMSPMEIAARQLGNRMEYYGAGIGDIASKGMVGLDNVGTYISNQFRPKSQAKPYMSVEEGQEWFRTGLVDSPDMVKSRANIASQLTQQRRDTAIQKIIDDKDMSIQNKYELLREHGMSVAAAKKLAGVRY